MILDLSKPNHIEAEARLKDEPVIWLTTVSPAGRVQSSLVWFLWDGSEFLIYGSQNGPKTPNIRANPNVSLHLDSDGEGGGVVVFEGTARIEEGAAGLNDVGDYLAKYGDRISAMGWQAEGMARDYPHLIRVTPTRARIF
jgi:PPOX class probable F420-dependent enzyme